MSREADLPDGKSYKPTPQPLIELCLACRRVRCDGMKCDDYKKLEREIKMQQKKSEPPKPRMEITPLAPDGHDAVANASGLRLLNIAIDVLDKLLADQICDGIIQDAYVELTERRFRMFGERIDWRALEREDEM